MLLMTCLQIFSLKNELFSQIFRIVNQKITLVYLIIPVSVEMQVVASYLACGYSSRCHPSTFPTSLQVDTSTYCLLDTYYTS